MKRIALVTSTIGYLVFLVGCQCNPTRPPQTFMAGMIGYTFEEECVPKLSRFGANANTKCFMVPVKNESTYPVSRAFYAMCDDLFETAVFDAGYKVAAKEAVEVIANKVGAQPLEKLFDPEVQDKFVKAIQQEGTSIVDFVFLVRLTGLGPSLQAQGKIICTKAGPDFGEQIPARSEINWKTTWCDYQDEAIADQWKQRIKKGQL